MSRPNCFLLVIDSLRADAAFGDHISTPNFESYSAQGATFRQCVSTSTTTTPSFSSLFTGCYPPKHGVRGLKGYRLSTSLTTLAEAFGRAGYHTHAEVTGPLLPETGILRGFESARHRQAKIQFFGWREEVIERMRTYVAPWFMVLHIWEVHAPYRSPPDFVKRRDKAGYEAAVAATDEWLDPVFDAAEGNTIVVITGDHGEHYLDSVVDLQLLRIARHARRSPKFAKWFPRLDSKLAGIEIGHGFALHDHLVRVPLVMAGPEIPGVTVEDQVRHVDLFPTIADLCDLESPSGIDGHSLRPVIEGRPFAQEPAYMEAVGVALEGRRIVGARTHDWKLLLPGGGRPALYKLDDGVVPNERRNLYRHYPEMARRLETFIEQVAATETVAESGMSPEEEAIVEQHLRDLGYL